MSTEHVIFGTGAIGLATYDALRRRGITPRMVNRSGAVPPRLGIRPSHLWGLWLSCDRDCRGRPEAARDEPDGEEDLEQATGDG